MSLIGIFNRFEKVDDTHIEKMYQSIKKIPYYDYEKIFNNNIGIGLLKNKINSRIFFDNTRNIIFLFEGNLYNKEELCSQFNFDKSLTDEEIVFDLFLKYKKDCLNKLIGQFYFLFFDIDKNNLFLGRDNHGYTSMHYYYNNNSFIFSSNIKAILSLNNINKEIDEEKAIGILSIWYPDNYKTMYKNIYMLPPAHYIEINNNKFIKNRYWYPENININYKYKNDYEYSEELLDLLNNAIKIRIKNKKNVSSMLSGGFDSSTVSVLTANLLKEKNSKLKTYSHIPFYKISNSDKLNHRLLDEKENILEIINFNKNIDSKLIDSKSKSIIQSIIDVLNITETPIHGAINSYWLLDIFENSKNDNNDILLSGEHGNASISLAGLDYLLPFTTLNNIFGLKKAILKKYLKRFVFYEYRSWKERFFIEEYVKRISYLNIKYLSNNRIKKEFKDFIYQKYSFYTNQEYSIKILQPGNNIRCYFGGLLSEHYGIEFSDPTADKKVIEYILSIPNEFFFDKDGYFKNILRVMMKDLLPKKVLNNKNKGLQAGDIGQRFFNERNEIREYLEEFKKVDLIKNIVDIKRLENDFNYILNNSQNRNYDNFKIGIILRTFMVSYFIYKFYNKKAY